MKDPVLNQIVKDFVSILNLELNTGLKAQEDFQNLTKLVRKIRVQLIENAQSITLKRKEL